MKQQMINEIETTVDNPIHQWFGLSYSSYLVVHRCTMCAMPIQWQEKMVALLEEIGETIDGSQMIQDFTVQARDQQGRFIKDPYANYRNHPPIPFCKKDTS